MKKESLSNSQTKLQLIFQEGDLPSLHPHKNITHIRCVGLNKLLLESLTRIDENQKAVLAGANSVNISEDKMEYTFTLRDCKWSNGDPIAAYDYETAWRSAISPGSICLRPDLFYVIKNAQEIRQGKKNMDEFGAKALDEKTLQIKLAYPCDSFLELVASSIFAPIKESEPTIFNGPFVVDKWNKTESLTLTKNQNYWDKKSIQLDRIDISFIRDISTGFSLFQKQKVDWIGSPISVVQSYDAKNIEKNSMFKKRLSDFIFWLHINTRLSHLQSKYIRKALSCALDRKLINDTILLGGEPISFLPTNMASIKQVFEYDPERAKELFAKGLQELKIQAEDFPEIELSFFNRPKMKMLAQYLAQAWQKILNIRIRLIEKDWNYFRSSQEKGDFDIAGCYESALFPDPMDFLQLIEERQGWNKEAYQKALSRVKNTLDEKQKALFLKESLEILAEEMPVIVLSNEKEIFASNPLLKGYFFDCGNSVDFSRAYFER